MKEVLFDIWLEVAYLTTFPHALFRLLRIDTQFDVFKLIVHGCSIIYKVVYLL